MKFYAVAHHGTAGLDSYGYAEVWEGERPRSDQTTTVWGPYETRAEAQAACEEMERPMDAYRAAQDAR